METRDIINSICASIGVLLHFVIAFTIIQNRKTITKTNIIILNYSCADLLGHIVTFTWYLKNIQPKANVCGLNAAEVLHEISVILLMFILAFDCILELRMKDFFVLIGLIWALASFVCVLFYVLCKLYDNSHPIDLIILTVYVTTLLIVVGKRVFNCVKNVGSKVIVDIVIIYMLLTATNVAQVMRYTPEILSVMEWFLQPVESLFPFIFCVYLFYIDKHIREYCLTFFKCTLQKGESTTNITNMDDDTNSVDFSYSRENEDMVT